MIESISAARFHLCLLLTESFLEINILLKEILFFLSLSFLSRKEEKYNRLSTSIGAYSETFEFTLESKCSTVTCTGFFSIINERSHDSLSNCDFSASFFTAVSLLLRFLFVYLL